MRLECGIPGLRIETLRHAQGRFWGTHCGFGRVGAWLQRDVLEVGMEGYGHGGGKRPWSRGPDDGVDFAAGEGLIDCGGV